MTHFGIHSELRLGTLAYWGSPTPQSMIVYFSVDQVWVRVPVPEVTPSSWRDAWRRLWGQDLLARWLMVGMGVAVLCVGLGLYGLLQRDPTAVSLKLVAGLSGHFKRSIVEWA